LIRTIIAEEGAGNLYRGIISPILAEAPKRALKFSSNEQYKKLLAGKTKSSLQNLTFI
jgi:solute carrier family 25 2-oxodicarboxylate transporter 21